MSPYTIPPLQEPTQLESWFCLGLMCLIIGGGLSLICAALAAIDKHIHKGVS